MTASAGSKWEQKIRQSLHAEAHRLTKYDDNKPRILSTQIKTY